MAVSFRQRMLDFLFGDERQDLPFRNSKDACDRWKFVEKEAVTAMNDLETCLYIIYWKFTRDVSIITPIFNATFKTSYTRAQVDNFLVPVRAMVLMKYLIEEENMIGIEHRERYNGKLINVRYVWHWRYLVDTQINEANIALLLGWSNWAESADEGYVSDNSDSSDDESYCSSHSSRSNPGSLDSEDSDEDERHEIQAQTISLVNPVTGRFPGRTWFHPPFRRPRPWDLADDKISAIIQTFPFLYNELFGDGAAHGQSEIVKFGSDAVLEILCNRKRSCFPFWRCLNALTRLKKNNCSPAPLREKPYDFQALWEWAESNLLEDLEDTDFLVTERDALDGSNIDYVVESDGSLIRIA